VLVAQELLAQHGRDRAIRIEERQQPAHAEGPAACIGWRLDDPDNAKREVRFRRLTGDSGNESSRRLAKDLCESVRARALDCDQCVRVGLVGADFRTGLGGDVGPQELRERPIPFILLEPPWLWVPGA
jgi:hypothetical protein